ncbi:hypothetical protein O23A_p3329 [Aeromonas salmonicida]|nr:hypothetical protein O23A_p3329 [Aeromonas salmonicida]
MKYAGEESQSVTIVRLRFANRACVAGDHILDAAYPLSR